MTNARQYDDLYVISDLHIGGKPGFQTMNRGKRLGRFIQQLAVRPEGESGRRVGLVINGDFIDTLAEDFAGYVAVTDAVHILERLYEDEAFEPVWSALAGFVRHVRRRLVFTIGNHDIELALPAVQHSIRRRLAGDDEAADGRIEFAVEGAGYSCRVGNVRVFCTHGNEVDGWNVIDHGALRTLVRDQNAGMPYDVNRWTPCAGTRLVRDVMNRVKRQRPWVELLKPEKNVVLGVLLTIDPGIVRHVPALVPVAWNRGRGELQRRGLLSATESDEADAADVAESAVWSDVVGPQLQRAIGGVDANGAMARPDVNVPDLDPMLLDIERQLTSGSLVVSSLDDLQGTLGWPRMLFDRLQAVDSVEALRRALLDWHDDDRSFDLANEDETYRRILRQVGPNVDVIVTGHTHLERAIVTAARAYYNTGTWIRLMRFPGALLKDAAQFADLYKLLEHASLADLDDARMRGADGTSLTLVADVTTALHITAQTNVVVACLGHVVDDAREGARFEGIAGSEFRGV